MNIEKINNIQLESIIANFDEETLTYNEVVLLHYGNVQSHKIKALVITNC